LKATSEDGLRWDLTWIYVWTRRLAIFGMVVGVWEALGCFEEWRLGSESDIRELGFWAVSAAVGFMIWYRLRDIESEMSEKAARSASAADSR